MSSKATTLGLLLVLILLALWISGRAEKMIAAVFGSGAKQAEKGTAKK